ncbi:MAG: radical SAM protein [Omnitrophica WOR_2 bacterium RIFCSPHIGHO2_02_FULL_52_10]|nr:MAG: radical SAM protein [Omnitrophica WOR_2 bacterium RIFCSPHIGHO2_02_FULL_52_10]
MVPPRTSYVKPRRLRLETSTACQLKCPSCPTASGETGKRLGIGFLKFSDFKKIVDDNPWVSNIELSNWREIFLNKELPRMMAYAYKRNVALHAVNGANLNNVDEKVLEALVKYRFQNITCSIDGASQEIYSMYRVRGNFDRVIANIKTINKYKAKYRTPYPKLKWQFVAFGHNEHQIGQARKMAGELNMSFKVKLSWENLYGEAFSPIKDKDLIRRETGSGAASRQEMRDRQGMDIYAKNCCLDMWINPQVNYDGRLLGCAVNYWGDFGNAYQEGLLQSLNNEKMVYAREMLMGRRASRPDIPCTACTLYKIMQKNNYWLTDEDVQEHYWKSRTYVMLENKVLGPGLTARLAESRKKLKHLLKP